jgi:NAD(P)-dependent dehydrogenase (short-subunit alcohol dehydrogenase family)
MRSMRDSVVFVTGAGRGVGRAVAVSFAELGAKVAVQDISPVNLEETLRLVRTAGSDGLELVGDMSKKMQAQSMIELARAELGEIDILINRWAVAPAVDLLTVDEWDWDRTLGVNLKGHFLSIQSIGRLMSDRGEGLIVNLILPPTRFDPAKNYPVYEVSAAGLHELTVQAGNELRSQGVQVFGLEAGREGSDFKVSDTLEKEVTFTWWQRQPEVFALALVELCVQAEDIGQGQVLTVERDGSVRSMKGPDGRRTRAEE